MFQASCHSIQKSEWEGETKERLQGEHCFLHFSRSGLERENSDWSKLIKL